MLSVEGLNLYYGGSHILRDMALQVPKGACVCLMGRNGMGKTTLLKAIMGLVPVRSGAVRFDGRELNGAPPYRRARLGIGYVPQGREIFPELSVEENLQTGLVSRKVGRSTLPERIFQLFPVLKQMLQRRGGNLSGGQQQQLAIGRALALEPSLLILDEPTEGIQPNIIQEIGEIIVRLNREEGLTVLLVEQKLKFARHIAEYFCMMEKGHAVATGPMAALDEKLIGRYLTV
ncbi:MAG: urea ABC transporter ATP-binding subunit UrtE [Candidatus Competibacteraceae bacterium]